MSDFDLRILMDVRSYTKDEALTIGGTSSFSFELNIRGDAQPLRTS
jgi:hypothetical protein